MSLDSIVDVQIVNTTVSVSQAGFGVPLIADYNTRFAVDRVRYYSSLAAMVSDGFQVTDFAYLAAAACLSQNPRPTKIGIGRRLTVPTMLVDLTPTAQNSRDYSVTINGKTVTITSDSTATVAEICTALATAINGDSTLAATVTATDGTTKVTVIADVAGTPFTLDVSSNIARADITGDAGLATDLNDFLAASRDWYALIITSKGKAEIDAASDWTEANKRLFAVSSGDTEILDSAVTTDVASVAKAQASARTAVYYHQLPHQFLEAGVFGKLLPEQPGSANWNFKTIAGVTVSALTDTQQSNLDNKTCNYYAAVAGLNLTQGGGKVAANEYTDIVIGLDWLRARLQESLFALLAGSKKVPFTTAGITAVESVVRARLRDAVNAGLLVDGTTQVVVPNVADVSDADKANRHLPDVQFSGTLAGAINSLQLSGSVSV